MDEQRGCSSVLLSQKTLTNLPISSNSILQFQLFLNSTKIVQHFDIFDRLASIIEEVFNVRKKKKEKKNIRDILQVFLSYIFYLFHRFRAIIHQK